MVLQTVICTCLMVTCCCYAGAGVRRRRRGLLHMYYGMDSGEVSRRKENPLDIDSTGFKSEQYIEHLLKESSLNELYASERQMRKGTSFLNSSTYMHIYVCPIHKQTTTLVYHFMVVNLSN